MNDKTCLGTIVAAGTMFPLGTSYPLFLLILDFQSASCHTDSDAVAVNRRRLPREHRS